MMTPRLVMCCTPINREDYLAELRYAVLASEFFRYLYPGAQVSIGTTPNAVVPSEYDQFFDLIKFPFEDGPFALQRQKFYKQTIESSDSDIPLIFAGVDVLFTNRLGDRLESARYAYSYRYHPAMPYCSDFFFVNSTGKEEALKFQEEVINVMSWQPQSIRSSWADQISIAAVVGHLKLEEFDGRYTKAPRLPALDLVPGDIFLYTPNDAFFSDAKKFNGYIHNDVVSDVEWLRLFDEKVSVHFKGNRKRQFFFFAALGYILKRINPYRSTFSYPFERLFDGFIRRQPSP